MKFSSILRSFVAVMLVSLTLASVHAATNVWTSLVTGNWHDPSWSLNALPSYDQDSILINNDGSKAVIISAATAENHPSSLQIRNLAIESPTGWTNTLLLNYLSGREPLTVFDSAFVGSGGVLMNLYSKLDFPGSTGSLMIDGGTFVQEGGTTTVSNDLFVGRSSPGTFALTNGTFFSRKITVGMTNRGLFIQNGGSVTSDAIRLGYSSATYQLESGQLEARFLDIGDQVWPYESSAHGTFNQKGGTLIVDDMSVGNSGANGEYLMTGGIANIRSLTVSQSGSAEFRIQSGHASVDFMTVSVNQHEEGTVILEGGELQTGRATVGYSGWGSIHQYGGTHNIRDLTVSGDSYGWVGTYDLTNGFLNAGDITLTTGVMYQSGGTNRVTNSVSLGGRGSGFTLSGGALLSSGCGISGGSPDERSVFSQSGGTHQINGSLGIGGQYIMSGGTLVASSISLSDEGDLIISGGAVLSNGAVSFSGGSLSTSLPELTLGTLQINQAIQFSSWRPRISFPTADCIIRFTDSGHLTWDSETHLWIAGWKGELSGSGSHQLFIGTGQTLRSEQLSRIRFENPSGLPPGSYFAKQLSSGQIVPSQSSYVEFIRQQNGLRFEWEPQWSLEFSPNPQGPYEPVESEQTSYTGSYSGRSGFFRLRKKP